MHFRPKRLDRHAVNAYERFVAGAHDKPGPEPLPPKADRIKRADGKPIHPTEHQLQAALISWWGSACRGFGLPHFALFAIPNGGARDVITGARLKAEGVRRGTPDLFLAVPRHGKHGLFIEMKAKTGRTTDEQEDFIAFLNANGYVACTKWDTETAIDAIREYLVTELSV